MLKLTIAVLLSLALTSMIEGARSKVARKSIHQLGDQALDGHPACNSGVPEDKCPCSRFYDKLVEECLTDAKRSRETCVGLVSQLWKNDGLRGHLLGFNTFISSDIMAFIIPLFWAGFSWTLGTRFVLDEMVKNISLSLGDRFELRDIEHASSPIGRLMRKLHWSRHCHNTRHDSKFWLSLSQDFARGVAFKAVQLEETLVALDLEVINSMNYYNYTYYNDTDLRDERYVEEPKRLDEEISLSKSVYIAVNYEFQRLQSSFLFQHEMPLLGIFHTVTILDLKNSCNKAMIEAIRTQIWSNASKFGRKQLWKNSNDIKCVDGSAQGENSRIVQVAQKQIIGLEAGHARGIIWKRKDMHALWHLIPNVQVANFTECQEACNSYRTCKFFNYHETEAVPFWKGFWSQKWHECELFHRDDNVEYFVGDPRVISGHKKKASTGIES